MNFFLIVGPQAVGKMTVGQELSRLTKAKLFFNHMTIDLVDFFFDYSTPQGKRLVKSYRDLLFSEVIHAVNYPGFIFTYVCDYETEDGLSYMYDVCNEFENAGHTSYIIELNADDSIREMRNTTENRMRNKRLKRDIAKSKELFQLFEQSGRTQSIEGEIKWPRYLRINNSSLSPEDAANMIIKHFNIPVYTP